MKPESNRRDAEAQRFFVLRLRRSTIHNKIFSASPRLCGELFIFSYYKLIQRLTAFRATSLAGRATKPVRLIDTLYFAPSVMGKKTALP